MANQLDDTARRRRRRSRTHKKKKPSKKAQNLLQNLGWIALAAGIGLPILALALYALH